MEYTAESLIPVMAHIAKNVVKVNEGQTKHVVSAPMVVLGVGRVFKVSHSNCSHSVAGCQKQVLHFKADEDRHHLTAQVDGGERLGKASGLVG